MMIQWWDAAKIEATVTRQYVCSQLLPQEIARLDLRVEFGDGLTDGTYWDWIDSKVKRIFLILVDLGMPDQIFGIIDDSWCDNDLPIPPESIPRLALTAVKDEKIERKFYQRQFTYITRPLQRGEHLVYSDPETVPLEVLDRRQGLTGSSTLDKVVIPSSSNAVFWRRRVPLGPNPGCMMQSEFRESVESMKALQNDHVVSYWGSYVHQGVGYVLFSPASDFNLKSFLATQPASYKSLPKKERKELVMNWILCLVDTLSFLHSKNRSHCYIKPSAILFTNKNHVFFLDSNRFGPDGLAGQTDKSSFDREWYDYAAPEQWFRPMSGPTSPSSRKATVFSTSPETQVNISIPRSEFHSQSPNAMLLTPNPSLNPQPADIFSLGCIILELLSFVLKKQQKFAAHRAAKHKTPGRGGAVPDSSFHKNLGQVEGWMSDLAREANKKISDKDASGDVFRGITPMLHVVARMLSANPHDRPSAREVQRRVYQILTDSCHITEPHCVHQYAGDFDFGFGQLRVAGPESMAVRQPTALQPMQIATQRHGGSIGSRTGSRHVRGDSSGGTSNSGSSTTSSERERERELVVGLGSIRDLRSRGEAKSPTWQANPMYHTNGEQAPVY